MILPVENLVLNSWRLLEVYTAKNTEDSANTLIFSDILRGQVLIRFLQKLNWTLIVSLIIILIIIKYS